jgi:predicted ribosomally synthesized peptide with SipW-like signal peptide
MRRKTILKLTCIIAITALITGVTLAYFTDATSVKTNTFTVSDGLSIKLAEPTWDNLDYDGDAAGITEDLGEDLADNIVPGRTIPKDPSVLNDSENDDVWVAIKLAYSGTANSFALINAFADINFDTVGWEAKDATNTVFYYKTQLEPDDETTDLFTRVLIDTTAANGDLKPFTINIKAYAVQAEGLTYADAKTQLDTLMTTSP